MRVKLFCVSCRTQLLRYNKSGTGALVKLHPSRVTADRSIPPCGNGSDKPLASDHGIHRDMLGISCPTCQTVFARVVTIGGQVYRKLIGGKVFVKGGVATR